MHGTPTFRGSLSTPTLESSHSIISSSSIRLNYVHTTNVTCSVDFNELSHDVCNYLKNVKSDVQNQINNIKITLSIKSFNNAIKLTLVNPRGKWEQD